MIAWPLYLAFVVAVTTLMLIPGPNVALIVANSVAHGARHGLLTVAGTTSAMVVQLALTALGMVEALRAMGAWFGALRWIGVAYLLYLGVTQWRAAPVDLARVRPEPPRRGAIVRRALFVSLTNPKTLVFHAAFLPQFIDRAGDPARQMLALSATYLAIALVVDGGWALLAARARALLARHGRWRNRLSGGIFIGAGLGLATVRAP